MKSYTPAQLCEIDLHQKTAQQSLQLLHSVLLDYANKQGEIRIIVGQGRHSTTGPVLPQLVKDFCKSNALHWRPAKYAEGGNGVIVITLK